MGIRFNNNIFPTSKMNCSNVYREIAFHKERQRIRHFYKFYLKELKKKSNAKEEEEIAKGIELCLKKSVELEDKYNRIYEQGTKESNRKGIDINVTSEDIS